MKYIFFLNENANNIEFKNQSQYRLKIHHNLEDFCICQHHQENLKIVVAKFPFEDQLIFYKRIHPMSYTAIY